MLVGCNDSWIDFSTTFYVLFFLMDWLLLIFEVGIHWPPAGGSLGAKRIHQIVVYVHQMSSIKI